MRTQMRLSKLGCSCLLAMLATIVTPALAQIPAKGSYAAAMHDAIREIAKDPCNARGKFAALLPPMLEAARRAQAGTDDFPEMLQRIADTGCANAKLNIPKIELLLSAGKLGFLDACTYAPATDYSMALAMARTHYHPAGVGITQLQFREVPCMPEFIAALLTDQPVSGPAEPKSPSLDTAPPAPTRRRT